MSLQWSPGDLNRQRLVVGRAMERAASNRLRFATARRRVADRLRAVAVPVAVAVSVVAAALAVGRYVSVAGRRQRASRAERARTRPVRVQSLIALAMSLAQIYTRLRTLVAPPAETAGPARALNRGGG